MRKRYDVLNSEINALDDYKYESNKQKGSIHSVSTTIALAFCAFLLGLYGTVYLIDEKLPTPLKISDEKDHPDAFIAERAQYDLKLLTDIGPRVAGSYENEAIAVDFLKRELFFIQQQANLGQKIEIDVQEASGSYYLDFKPHGGINAYGKVQNVIAKLHSRNNSAHSILLNAHFDTVSTSPGGSDDGINCAVMLEILRKLSRSPTRLQHNVIFLFNGAEETPLHAAHGFITQHKWAKEVRTFINLEAAGSGGKIILFQTGPNYPWLVNYYAKVPYPRGQAVGEEIFQAGLIPSDSDYRIFRDFGNLIGFDFAFIKNGYRYHTKYDDFANIPLGSFQHVGDNTLHLVRELGNAEELSNPKEQKTGRTIYFDIFGWVLLNYSDAEALYVNIGTSVISVLIALKSFKDFGLAFSRQSFLYISLTTGGVILGCTSSIISVLAIGYTIDALKHSMSWYGSPWLIFGLYVIPILSCLGGAFLVLNRFTGKNNLSVHVQTQIQIHVTRLILTGLFLVGTLLRLRFVYIFLFPILFNNFAMACINVFNLKHTIHKWKIIYVGVMAFPVMLSMQQALQLVSFFVPICGRMGSEKNPELLIAIATFLVTFLSICLYVPLITLVRKPVQLLHIFAMIFVIFFVLIFTAIGFPYSGDPSSPTPQRFWIYHTGRAFRNDSNVVYKRDAGYLILNLDRNSPDSVKRYVKDLSNLQSVSEDCKKSLFCGLPIGHSRIIHLLPKSTWVPAEQPIIHQPINLRLNYKTQITNTRSQYNFTATGPNYLMVYISTRDKIKLVKTNLIPELPSEPIIWNGRPAYMMMYTSGKENTPLTFSLDVEGPINWNGPKFDVALIGKYMHDRFNVKTPHYLKFLGEFPNWTDVIPWLATYESWVY